MRKVLLITSVILATLCAFLLAPSFRQAISVSGAYIRIVIRGSVGPSVSQLLAMRDRAAANHDARTLAVVALLMSQENASRVPPYKSEVTREGEQSIAIAKQAVALDPSYTFIYLQVAQANQASPEFPQLMEALHRWDPENAVPYLAEARHSVTGGWKGPNATNWQEVRGPVWAANMEKAFRSPKYDSYYAQNYALILWASASHTLNSPMELAFTSSRVLFWHFRDIREYSQQLLSSNSATSAQKLANARQVANFADVMSIGAVPSIEKTLAHGVGSDALRAMSAIADGEDVAVAVEQHRREAQKLEVATARADPETAMMMAMQSNASAAQISVLIMVLSLVVLAFIAIRCAIVKHVSPASVVALWTNAAVFFGSCVTCYIAYRPYAAILEYLQRSPNPNNARLAFVFWGFLDNPLIHTFTNPILGWTLLLVLCAITLAWIITRNIMRFAQRNAPAHS